MGGRVEGQATFVASTPCIIAASLHLLSALAVVTELVLYGRGRRGGAGEGGGSGKGINSLFLSVCVCMRVCLIEVARGRISIRNVCAIGVHLNKNLTLHTCPHPQTHSCLVR